jgi:arginyl-tRNA synthetase
MAGRLAEAAGATMTDFERQGGAGHRPPPGPGGGPVARAVANAGADAVRYRLARTLPGRAHGEQAGSPVKSLLSDPYYSVSFAHADAASTLRWAADLGLARAQPDRGLAELLGEPPEVALLGELSWLAERVAGAARRDRPAELPRYLEQVAGAWLDCRERCPALPFGGRAAPREATGISARLWLAAATATVLATGLDLVGVAARDRL